LPGSKRAPRNALPDIMLTNAKGRAGETARALEIDRAGEHQISSESKPPRAPAQAKLSSAVAVYDGTFCIGHLVEQSDQVIALKADGAELGAFRNRREAFKAISASHLGEVRP
jgi:hypothetical protein